MKRYLILDCYVDEPTCLGVPPFISPYPRYIYGALIDGGTDESAIDYQTIDHLREQNYKIEKCYSKVFLIGGAVVPGRYLGAKIGTLSEIKKILTENTNQDIAAGGLINRALKTEAFNIDVINNDIEKYAWSLVSGNPEDSQRTIDEIAKWSMLGSPVVKMHPWFPNVICEIETGRGCPRLTHCSFCSEGLYRNIEFRHEKDILKEIDSLTSRGITRFRIGRQADIIQYMTPFDEFNRDFPKPNVNAVKSLFGELKDRKNSGTIEVLSVDNGNPGSIICWPDESSKALKAIADTVTEGDTLPFGIESFDPEVVKANRLKVMPEEAIFAIKILNEIGGERRHGIPKLLPGINLIHGLKDETPETFRLNYEYLKRIVDEGYLIKRINIRKLMPYPGTILYEKKQKVKANITKRFEYYKDKIRNEIDRTMLKCIYPTGTILENNIMLETRDEYSLGKKIGSYSITVKVPGKIEQGKFANVLITGQRERSLSGITLPFDINKASPKAFETIPGINKNRASKIILSRPFNTINEILPHFSDVPAPVLTNLIKNSTIGDK